jgi:uncharacterized membrane protein YdjX (TVP38/TMEM64 family)
MGYFIDYVHQILISYPIAAPIGFIAVQMLMAIFFMPCSPMTILAGVLWGAQYGLLISVFSSLVASSVTFLIARIYLREKIEIWINNRIPKLCILMPEILNHDWKVVAVSQLNPIMPASTLGYFFGLSPIKFTRYLGFSLVFMLPLQFLFVFTGNSIFDLLLKGINPVALIVIFSLLVFFTMHKWAYKKLCQILGVNNEI